MIRYKINVLQALKDAGYNTNRLRKNKIMGEATIQKLRHDEIVSWHNIGLICQMTGLQPGDLVEYVEDPAEDPADQDAGRLDQEAPAEDRAIDQKPAEEQKRPPVMQL